MSYPTIEAPYGLVPVNLIGGQVYAGGVRHLPIASGYAGAIANGDAVKFVAGGTVELELGSAAMVTTGTFVGCMWTDADRGLVNANRYPGGIVAADIVALVVDDPAVVMRAAVFTDIDTAATVTRAAVGANLGAVSVESTVAHGRSNLSVLATPAITATLPFRVVDVVEESSDGAGNYSEVLVVWNDGHQLNNTTGVV